MADIKATVIVGDKGLQQTTTRVRDLKRGLDETSRSAKAADAATKDAFHNMEKGTLGIGSAGQNFSKLARSIKGGDNSLVGAYATLAANIFSITAAFQALKEAAQFQQIQAGLELMGNRLGYTLSNASARVKELSGGLLSTEQAMRSTAQVISAGFKTGDLERITKVAKDASFALGRDMTESMDRLTRGVIKLEPELLDELGIMVRLDEANKVYAKSINKTATQLTLAERQQAFLNAALAEGKLKFDGISKVGENLNGIQQLSATFQDLTKNIISLINVAVIPLAKFFSNSPGALLGGMIMFASTISKQLIPGIANLEKQTLKLAEAKKAELAIDIANFQFSGKRNDTITDLQNKMKANIATTNDYKLAISQLNDQIIAAQAATRVRDDGGKFTNKNNYIQEKQLIIASLQDIMVKEMEAAQATAMSKAVVAASTKNLRVAYEQLTVAMALNMSVAKASGAGFQSLSGVIKLFAAGIKSVAMAMEVAAVAFLEFLNVIGIIIIVGGILIDVVKGIYTSMVGKEVIEARKALSEITDNLSKKTEEYNRIRQSSGNLAMKEVMAAELLSNSFAEQANAIDTLRKAEEARDRKRAGTDGKPVSLKEARINTQITDARSWRLMGLSEPAELLIKNLKEGTPEVRAAALEMAGGVEELAKVLKSPELSGDVIVKLTERFKDAGPALRDLMTNLKAVEDAYNEFIKSASPTTPYDKLVTELGKTSDSLTDSVQLMAEGKLSAQQLANTLSSMGSITLSQTSSEVQKLVSDLKKLEEVNNRISILESSNKKNTTEYTTAKAEQVSISQSIEKSMVGGVLAMQKELILQRDKAELLQTQSIAISGQLALAQANLNVVSSYNDLSGKGTMDRLKAENAIKGLQSQQLKLQADYLAGLLAEQRTKLAILQLEIQSNKEKARGLGLQLDNLDILELSVKLQDPKLNEKQKAAIKAQIDSLQTKRALELETNRLAAAEVSTRQQAAAAAAGMHSAEKIRAAGEATLAKTRETITKNDLSIQEETFKLREANLKLQQTELGIVKDIEAEYNLLVEKQTASIAIRRAAIKREYDTTIKTLEAQKQASINAGGGAQNTAFYNTQIDQQTKLRDLKLQQLDIADTQARLDLIGIRSAEQVAQERLDRLNDELDIQTKLLDATKEMSSATRELDAINRRLNGTPESKIAELKNAAKIAKEEYDNNLATFNLRQLIIDAEYELLEAKLKATDLEITKRNKLLDEELQRGTISIETYNAQYGTQVEIKALIDRLHEARKAAKDANAAVLELGQAKVKEATTGVSISGGSFDIKNLVNSFKEVNSTNLFDNLQAQLLEAHSKVGEFSEKLKELGPNGEAVSAFASGALIIADAAIEMSKAFTGIQESLTSGNKNGVLKGIADFAAAGAAVAGNLNSIYQASARAKIAAIDSEISAEQKRDGKSAESVAKLAALEKKKDAMAKKAFEMNKKLMIVQAIMSTAAGVAGALASSAYLTPMGATIMAGVIGAIGAAQVALIAGMQYQSTASATAVTQPSSLSIGRRGSSVDLARSNMNTGGELGYLTGATGYGSSPETFTRRAYGGPARAGMVVGEKGPELFVPSVPGTVISNDNIPTNGNINANITIQAIDAEGVEQVLTNNRGHIIGMLREAANASGQGFLESVNTNKYRRGGTRL